ncbi:ATP-binding cassette subfamily B protein/subfamily B ATP-binding cassette protein MsbA [Paenibacillus castaneae]|uniref:ABC transporter ATP-binding protein n=1 Tax=Paenibacillus castaneae TaxID=474957 RepID=UPI00141B0B4A|nr:ABC transporter ATP-binding protein [Paenibacillus castaneae]NIK77712.1 ATP-binding cassette subfamily B protein/subfamily B ATP-binding cassette protein MsbA [Paenibacillus castaneae]
MNQKQRSIISLIHRKGFKQFLMLCKRYQFLYLSVLVLQLGGTGATLLLAEFSRRIFDGGTQLSHPELVKLIIGIVTMVILAMLFSLGARICNQIVNTNIVFRMRQMLLNQLTNISLKYHESNHSAHTQNILFNELEVFKQFVVFDVLRLISLPFSFIAIGVYLFTVNPLLGAIAILVGPLQLLSNLVLKGSFKDLIAQQQANGGEVFFHMNETLSGIREVKMNQLEHSVYSRFERVCKEGIRLWVSVEKMEALREFVRLVPEKLGYLMGISVGAILLVNGHIGPGAVIAFLTLLDKVSEPFISITSIISSLQRVSAGAENLLDVMEKEQELKTQGEVLSNEPCSIRFENVSFSYQIDRPVLHNVSFEIPAGKSVALVGPSGSGKSTLIKLLYRFYEPDGGSIKLNENPIENYTVSSLREQLATVTQDVYLFDGTIRENIEIGAADAAIEDVIQAAKLSQSTFIERLPEGLDTRVGERGIKLSHGQRQRIGISRAILRRASILILDEPTSALDVETEAMFQSDLPKWAGNSTKIIIAHRLSTIRDVDYIIFLENGRVQEMGSPKDLLKANGRFSDFWKNQQIHEFVS